MIQDYKELDVWKKSIALTTEIYKLTFRFPDTERYRPNSPNPKGLQPQSHGQYRRRVGKRVNR